MGAYSRALKLVTFQDDIEKLGSLIDNTMLSTALPKPKIDFVRDEISERPLLEEDISIDDLTLMSTNIEHFYKNLETI